VHFLLLNVLHSFSKRRYSSVRSVDEEVTKSKKFMVQDFDSVISNQVIREPFHPLCTLYESKQAGRLCAEVRQCVPMVLFVKRAVV
jgi:hypothetical protein